MAILCSILLYGKRGWVVAGVGAFAWSPLAVGAFIGRDRVIRWNGEHAVLSVAMFGLLLFASLALITDVPTHVCVAVAVVGCAILLGAGSLPRLRTWSARLRHVPPAR